MTKKFIPTRYFNKMDRWPRAFNYSCLNDEGKKIADTPRLEAKTKKEFINLFVQCHDELFNDLGVKIVSHDLDLALKFKPIYGSHSGPLNRSRKGYEVQGEYWPRYDYYAGWNGCVQINFNQTYFKDTYEYCGFNNANIFRLITGTGSGGGNLSADVNLFIDDCPKILERVGNPLLIADIVNPGWMSTNRNFDSIDTELMKEGLKLIEGYDKR